MQQYQLKFDVRWFQISTYFNREARKRNPPTALHIQPWSKHCLSQWALLTHLLIHARQSSLLITRIWQNWSTWNESKSAFRFPNEYMSVCCTHVLNLFWDGCRIIHCPWWTHGAWRNARRQTWTKVSRNARPCKKLACHYCIESTTLSPELGWHHFDSLMTLEEGCLAMCPWDPWLFSASSGDVLRIQKQL